MSALAGCKKEKTTSSECEPVKGGSCSRAPAGGCHVGQEPGCCWTARFSKEAKHPQSPRTRQYGQQRRTCPSGWPAASPQRPLCPGDRGVSGHEQHRGPDRVLERGYHACPRATPQSFVACANFKTRLFLLSVSSHTWKRPQCRPLSPARIPKAEPEACVLLLNNSPLVSRNQAS